MSLEDLQPSEAESDSEALADAPETKPDTARRGRGTRILSILIPTLVVVAIVGFFALRYYTHTLMQAALPQLDGTIVLPRQNGLVAGISAPVTVERDARGVPHIHAASLDDLVFAQGFITAQDRLWQMELLRRHAAGQLAEVLGSTMIEHDRLQRTLQMRAAADRAIAVLPLDQRHWLDVYAHGVNASMTAQRAHLPLEFRVLQYQPNPWTPRDSLLIELAMFQDLTTGFPVKLNREALSAKLSPELMADLYPVGSWRDHPPGQPEADLTAPQPEFQDIPLDESQSRLRSPAKRGAVPVEDLLALQRTLALFHRACDACVAGSNGWAVAGSHTASGKPMLSNDMHLSLTVPGLWYEAVLDAQGAAPMADFHVAGVTLPGTPFIIAGRNAHVAWGFTNLGADVQDVYIEHTRGTPKGAEYQTTDGTWQPVRYHPELIHVRGGADVSLNVPFTHHGSAETPVISSLFPGEKRTLSLRWTVYDPANLTAPFFNVDSATDWTTMLGAFQNFGGPAQNLMYADDQGHIGYHAVGRIPLRGDTTNPTPLAPMPTDAVASDAASHEWAGYIPFDQLPQAFDPPSGVLATANARVTLPDYKLPITLNWYAPYRTERIYKVLETAGGKALDTGSGKPPIPYKSLERRNDIDAADMLALQTDVFSESDHIFAQRLAYAIDHSSSRLKKDKTLHQAADLLRNWNGTVDAAAAAPAIVDAARAVFWQMLLVPKLAPQLAAQLAKGDSLSIDQLSPAAAHDASLWKAYVWGERESVEEQLVTHSPARWLPQGYPNWDDFLTTVVYRGLQDAHAPRDLSGWQMGHAFPFDLEHPIFSRSKLLENLIAVPTGTGPRWQSGDDTTVKQIAHAFGPSERFTADLADPDHTTLNLVLGQSANPLSPWFMDQFPAWLHGTTYPLSFTPAAVRASTTHTLTLRPQ